VSLFPINKVSRSTIQTIAVGATGAAWIVRDDVQKIQMYALSWQGYEFAKVAIDSLLNRLNTTPFSGVQWVVAPSLLKHWLQQPPDHIQSLSELHAVTRQRAQQLFGNAYPISLNGQASSWVVSADWHVSQPFLCGAIPASWYAVWTKEATQRNSRAMFNPLSSITSPLQLTLSKFQKILPADGWIAVLVSGTLYLMYFKTSQCMHFRSLNLSETLRIEDLQAAAIAEWQRDSLRTQLYSDQLHWLCVMPLATPSKTNNPLLMHLNWESANTTELLNVINSTYTDPLSEVPADLYEVKLTAWSAWQCVQTAL
jgi:hypothetical protein